MKKILFVVFAVLLAAGCAKTGYDDIRTVMNDMLDAQEAYVDMLVSAESADDVAAGMDALAKDMETIGPKIKELTEKYPDIMKNNQLPEELKDINERQAALQEKSKEISMEKIGQFMNDPKVMEAANRMGEAMRKMM